MYRFASVYTIFVDWFVQTDFLAKIFNARHWRLCGVTDVWQKAYRSWELQMLAKNIQGVVAHDSTFHRQWEPSPGPLATAASAILL